MNSVSLVVAFVTVILPWVSGSCYFPGELQGVWATQAAPDVPDAPIAYSMVTIEANYISTWGHCHSKIGNNIILTDKSGPRSAPCFRCFRLVVASVNVAALVSGGLESCFASMEDALSKCPTTERGAAHIILFKMRSSWGGTEMQNSLCPFSGIYFFSFERGEKGNRGRRNLRCEQPTSEMSNCPFGFSLSLQYRDCTFDDPRAANWLCLGSWNGLDGQKYTAVMNMYSKEGDGKAKYKCGIFEEDKERGRVYLSFSRDSTCTNDLVSAKDGYERYVLYAAPTSPLPTAVRDVTCRFPSSLRGEWQNIVIGKSSIKFRDERNYDTFHMQCVRDMGDAERYAVYTRTDCGKWFYNCILLQRRSANIIEIMLGKESKESMDADICNRQQFDNSSGWITQARTNLEEPITCPIIGTYKGELPDSPGYCAQLYSDCNKKDIMYYAIDECNDQKAVYERKPFPEPHQVKPGVFVPPERVHDFHNVRQLPPVMVQHGVPPEVRVGTINLLAAQTHSQVDIHNPAYDSLGRTSIRIIKKKKREAVQTDPPYRVGNPKTTAILFAWGNKNSPTTQSSFFGHQPSQQEDSARVLGLSDQRESDFGNIRRVNTDTQSLLNRESRNWNDNFNAQKPLGTVTHSSENVFDSRRYDQFDFNRQLDAIPVRTNNFETFNSHYNFQPLSQTEIPGNRWRQTANVRHDQNYVSVNSGVRSLPAARQNFNPLGFWPTGHRGNPAFRPSEKIDSSSDALVRGQPSFPGRATWSQSPLSTVPVLSDTNSNPTSSSTSHHINGRNHTKFRKEEREYQCIGEWKEDGNVYALTKRKDIHTYECFVGVINQHGIVYMKEAGSSCRRGIRPDDFGMRTVLKAECLRESTRSKFNRDTETEGWTESKWRSSSRKTPPTRPPLISSPTRPWEPITGRPRRSSSTSSTPSSFLLVVSVVFYSVFGNSKSLLIEQM